MFHSWQPYKFFHNHEHLQILCLGDSFFLTYTNTYNKLYTLYIKNTNAHEVLSWQPQIFFQAKSVPSHV